MGIKMKDFYDLNNVLCFCANLLDTIKGEWGVEPEGAWSHHDQKVRDSITHLLSAATPPVPDDVADIQLRQDIADAKEMIGGCTGKNVGIIQRLIRAASTPSPEAQAVSEVTVEEFTQELQHYRQFIHGAYISPAEYMLLKHPHGIKIKAGGE